MGSVMCHVPSRNENESPSSFSLTSSNEDTIEDLKDMFPSWDTAVIEEVVINCKGDIDAATDIIMSWSEEDTDKLTCTNSVLMAKESEDEDDTDTDTDDEPVQGTDPVVVERTEYDKLMRNIISQHMPPKAIHHAIFSAATIFKRPHLLKKSISFREIMRGQQKASSLHIASQGDPAEGSGAIADEKTPSDSIVEKAHQISLSNMTREEHIDEGLQLLQKRVEVMALHILQMKDDGNCQFRALANELHGHQRLHGFVRRRVVGHLRTHQAEYSHYVGDDVQWSEYVDNMALSKTWGDELTLRAASEVYECAVHCITTAHENWCLEYSPTITIPTKKNLIGRSRKSHSRSQRACFLAYISPIHYNVVCPLPVMLKENSSEDPEPQYKR